jgi:hypothetical protein
MQLCSQRVARDSPVLTVLIYRCYEHASTDVRSAGASLLKLKNWHSSTVAKELLHNEVAAVNDCVYTAIAVLLLLLLQQQLMHLMYHCVLQSVQTACWVYEL